jgi:integrase/recombinase XerC
MNAAELAAQLRAAFPDLSDADLAVAVAQGLSNQPTRSTITVREYVTDVRAIYAKREAGRLRADPDQAGHLPLSKTTTLRTYVTHWNRLVEAHGHRLLADITALDLESLAAAALQHAQATARERNRNRAQHGAPLVTRRSVGAHNTCVTALRAIFTRAKDDNLIERDPSARLRHLPKQPSPRHAITQQQLRELIEAAANGGNDPELDHLIIWTLSETACRREAILNLTVSGLRDREQAVVLIEKGDHVRLHPVTLPLLQALHAFAAARGATSKTDRVFRYLPDAPDLAGAPMTAKRFEVLFRRLRRVLPWANDIGLSAHWLRHTTLTWCERSHGLAVARAYAGHRGGPITLTYTKADFGDVARALVSLTGQPHPAANPDT